MESEGRDRRAASCKGAGSFLMGRCLISWKESKREVGDWRRKGEGVSEKEPNPGVTKYPGFVCERGITRRN